IDAHLLGIRSRADWKESVLIVEKSLFIGKHILFRADESHLDCFCRQAGSFSALLCISAVSLVRHERVIFSLILPLNGQAPKIHWK
ncbi:MAG: hypothetical protein JXA13_13845, partial [Anaerolineales bacterium]|nr:hypothetical protein [Anaerolineales bacterium]